MKNLIALNSPKKNQTFHKQGWKTEVDATEFITTNDLFGPGELIKPWKVIAGMDRVAIDAYCCTLW